MSNNRNITQLPVNSNLSTIEGFAAVDISGANVQISGQSIIDSIDAVTSVLSSNTALLTVTGGNVPTITVNTAPITKGGTGLATADQIVTYVATQTGSIGTQDLQSVLDNGSTATIEEIIQIESVDGNLMGRLNISSESSSIIQSRSSATSNRNERIVLTDGEIEIKVEGSSEASIEMEVKGVNDRKDTMSISSNSGTYIVSYPLFMAPDYNVYPRSELQINKDTLTLKYQEQDYDECSIELLPGYIQLQNNTNIDNPDPAVTVNTQSIEMGGMNIQLSTFSSNTATPTIDGNAEFILSPDSTRSEWKQTKTINGPQPVEVFNSIAFETEAMQLVNDWGNGDGRCKIELRDALIEVSTEDDDDPLGIGLGIRYAEDYSTNFVNESLITKRYVDTQMANQSAKRFDFNGNFLVYPVVFALGVAPESTEPILPNPTLQDIENANTINTTAANITAWVDLVVAGECGTLKQVLTLAVDKTEQIIQDEGNYEALAAQGYQFLQTQYQTFISDGQSANPPVDVSGLQSVLADITTARNISNALYTETVSELELLKQTYQQIISLADNQCGTGA